MQQSHENLPINGRAAPLRSRRALRAGQDTANRRRIRSVSNGSVARTQLVLLFLDPRFRQRVDRLRSAPGTVDHGPDANGDHTRVFEKALVV